MVVGPHISARNLAGAIAVSGILFVSSVATLVGATGCSQPQRREAETVDDTPTGDDSRTDDSDSESPQPNSDEPTSADEQRCLGTVTPPRGAGGEQYLTEPAITREGEIESVVEQARQKLIDRLCQGYRCESLAADVQTWEIQKAGPYRCSKAVIAKSKYESWLDEGESKLHTELANAARQIVESVDSGNDAPRLVLAPVEDHRAVGGPRARWLYDKMQRELKRAGAALAAHRPDKSARGDRIDGIVHGTVYTRETFEKLLEVTWELSAGDSLHPVDSTTFPEALSPEVDEATYLPALPEGDGSVEIHFDYLDGGGFCNGQDFELWVETSRDLHVRVVNLVGDGGQVIYPMEGQSPVVESGAPVSLGTFRAVRTDHPPVERWVVLAAPTREGLGKFASAEGVCRLPASTAHDLQRGRGLPEQIERRLASESYRIVLDGDPCESFDVSEATVERTMQALETTPMCWSKDRSNSSTQE